MGSVQSDYKEVFSSIDQYSSRVRSEELHFGMPACQAMSLELNGVESSEMVVAE
jgi:hypothetical protein